MVLFHHTNIVDAICVWQQRRNRIVNGKKELVSMSLDERKGNGEVRANSSAAEPPAHNRSDVGSNPSWPIFLEE